MYCDENAIYQSAHRVLISHIDFSIYVIDKILIISMSNPDLIMQISRWGWRTNSERAQIGALM